MAHYAFLNENNIVVEVIVGKNEDEDGGNWEQRYGQFRGMTCKRTSYNTHGGVHYDQNTNSPSADQSKAFRKNYAGIGYHYDPQHDMFYPPQPYPSWTLNLSTGNWDPPTPIPENGTYYWDEDSLSWKVGIAKPTTSVEVMP